MLTEPIIDIIVYGYPLYLPVSFSSHVFTKNDYKGHIRYFVNDEYSNSFPSLDNTATVGMPINQRSNVYNLNSINAITSFGCELESYISTLDTREYYDWLFNKDEKWSDLPDFIINDVYIRQAGSVLNISFRFDATVEVKPLTELNAVVGFFARWNNDTDEAWSDEPSITNEQWVRTVIT